MQERHQADQKEHKHGQLHDFLNQFYPGRFFFLFGKNIMIIEQQARLSLRRREPAGGGLERIKNFLYAKAMDWRRGHES